MASASTSLGLSCEACEGAWRPPSFLKAFVEIWNEFMMKRGWGDSSSDALAEAKRKRGFAQCDGIQTTFEFHWADESDDSS